MPLMMMAPWALLGMYRKTLVRASSTIITNMPVTTLDISAHKHTHHTTMHGRGLMDMSLDRAPAATAPHDGLLEAASVSRLGRATCKAT
jgi:hypothetical protein